MTDERGIRLFIGVDVSVECANQLREAAAALRDRLGDVSMSWVDPARYHVTLKYLGWTKPEVVHAIRDRVAAMLAESRELRFEVSGLGAFPKPEKARVLWAQVTDDGGLAALAQKLDAGLEPLGFASENRELKPHVTLGRLREVADLSEVVVGSEHQYSKTRCKFLNLFKSDVNTDGSGYPILSRWELHSSKRHRSDLEQRDN